MKKSVCILLSCLLLVFSGITAFAEPEETAEFFEEGDFSYNIIEEGTYDISDSGKVEIERTDDEDYVLEVRFVDDEEEIAYSCRIPEKTKEINLPEGNYYIEAEYESPTYIISKLSDTYIEIEKDRNYKIEVTVSQTDLDKIKAEAESKLAELDEEMKKMEAIKNSLLDDANYPTINENAAPEVYKWEEGGDVGTCYIYGPIIKGIKSIDYTLIDSDDKRHVYSLKAEYGFKAMVELPYGEWREDDLAEVKIVPADGFVLNPNIFDISWKYDGKLFGVVFDISEESNSYTVSGLSARVYMEDYSESFTLEDAIQEVVIIPGDSKEETTAEDETETEEETIGQTEEAEEPAAEDETEAENEEEAENETEAEDEAAEQEERPQADANQQIMIIVFAALGLLIVFGIIAAIIVMKKIRSRDR